MDLEAGRRAAGLRDGFAAAAGRGALAALLLCGSGAYTKLR